MATKKQKREAGERKHAEFMELQRKTGLAAQQADRAARAQKEKDQRAQKAKDVLDEHERQKRARRDIADAQRELAEELNPYSTRDISPGRILATYALIGSMMTEDDVPYDPEGDPQYVACSFALDRGQYCTGDVRFPATHSSKCPHYNATDLAD